jgi:hypothetical protein
MLFTPLRKPNFHHLHAHHVLDYLTPRAPSRQEKGGGLSRATASPQLPPIILPINPVETNLPSGSKPRSLLHDRQKQGSLRLSVSTSSTSPPRTRLVKCCGTDLRLLRAFAALRETLLNAVRTVRIDIGSTQKPPHPRPPRRTTIANPSSPPRPHPLSSFHAKYRYHHSWRRVDWADARDCA